MSGRGHFEWTPRRRKIVLDAIAEGTTQRDIARALGTSANTVARFLASPASKWREEA